MSTFILNFGLIKTAFLPSYKITEGAIYKSKLKKSTKFDEVCTIS